MLIFKIITIWLIAIFIILAIFELCTREEKKDKYYESRD